MQIPDSYFEDEVIDGFFIPSMMKRCWAAQVEVLEDVKKLCEKYNIRYFADSGTLLGTIRHGGFIPWDDDMDIGMLREDYEIFLDHADELPENYSILNWRNEKGWTEAFSRLVNAREITFREDFLKKYHNFPYATGVDIFPIDYLYRDAEMEKERDSRYEIVFQMARNSTGFMVIEEDFEHLIDQIEQMEDIHIDRYGDIRRQLFALCDKIISEVPREMADEVCLFPVWVQWHGSKCRKEAYFHTLEMPFEFTEIMVPIGYNDILQTRYGTYMQVNRSGGMHEYPFYESQEKILEEKIGWKSLEFQWDDTLVEYTGKVRGEEKEKKETIRQQVAQVEEMLTGKDVNLFQGIQGQIEQLKLSVADLHPDREEVVFLVKDPSTWVVYDEFYQREMQRQGVDVVVIPVPYFSLNMDRSICAQCYKDEGYPSEISVVSYENYDIARRHPNRIYFQIPFDDANPSFTVHPVFYASELVKYTDHLIYVPYLAIKEIGAGDEKSFFGMKYYVKMPGLIYADEILLPSENMRERYLQALTDFSGEKWKGYWEEKIKVVDYLPEESPRNSKKTILYYTDFEPFLNSPKQAMIKLRYNLNLFYREKDKVQLVWRPYAQMKKMLREHLPELESEYSGVVEEYRKAGWGIYDEGDDMLRNCIKQVDAFYGDPGVAAYYASTMGKPVLIQDIEMTGDEEDA